MPNINPLIDVYSEKQLKAEYKELFDKWCWDKNDDKLRKRFERIEKVLKELEQKRWTLDLMELETAGLYDGGKLPPEVTKSPVLMGGIVPSAITFAPVLGYAPGYVPKFEIEEEFTPL